jgi:hypothetical protein
MPEPDKRPDENAQPFSQVALDHAWNWFTYHANQRISPLRMFLLTTGAVTTAYFAAFEAEIYEASIGAAVFGAVSSFCFFWLDQRSSQLIKLGEAVLDKEQKRLKYGVLYDEICIIERTEHNKNAIFGSHRQNYRILFFTVMILYTTGFVWAIVKAIS